MKKAELMKLPVPKLREEALKIENIQGVHGMDKPTLIQVLADHHGIDISDKKAKMVQTARCNSRRVRPTPIRYTRSIRSA